MTHVNKKQIPKELRDKAWKRFDAEKFLTPSERILVEKRLAIAVLLEQELSYRKIGEMLDVTRTTVSFVKHHLKRVPRVSIKRESLKSKNKRESGWPLMSPREHMRRMLRG